MEWLNELYPEDESRLQPVWEKNRFFDPKIPYLGYRNVSRALREGDYSYFLTQARNSFFPDMDGYSVQESYRLAMNRGIVAMNALCREHLQYPDSFLTEEVHTPLELFEFIHAARQSWISARSGSHTPDPNLMFDAYDRVRKFGIGYRVLITDESPEVLEALRQYPLLVKWFNDKLWFGDMQETDAEGFTHSWRAVNGVRVYGNELPFRSRLKMLDSEGNIRYGSIFMKMCRKGTYPDEISDYAGFEFVVEDDSARHELVKYFSHEAMMTGGRLEAFDDRKRSDNTSSSQNFRVVKFMLRPPVPYEMHIPHHPLSGNIYERIPVEIQILTLADDKIRRENPDVAHKEYKKRQFTGVFPVWYPRKIYEPFLEQIQPI